MEFVLNTNHRPYRQQITPNTVEQDLIAAIKNREGLNRVQGLIEEGADISSLCDGHWTPLTLAAYLGQTDVVKYLLDIIKQKSCPVKDSPGARSKWRCTVDSVNDSGITPLICASQKGHIDICQLLLQAGANINCKSQHSGQTALLVAVDNKQFSVVELLLEWGADVQMTDNVGITPLYMAVDSNCCPIVKLLIEAGCDVNIGSQDHAPLFLAARRGFLPVVQMLCEAGCNKNVANKYGVTPLYEAALKGRNTVVEYLIEKGCDVNIVDMYNVSPLQVAAMAGNREIVEVLLRAIQFALAFCNSYKCTTNSPDTICTRDEGFLLVKDFSKPSIYPPSASPFTSSLSVVPIFLKRKASSTRYWMNSMQHICKKRSK